MKTTSAEHGQNMFCPCSANVCASSFFFFFPESHSLFRLFPKSLQFDIPIWSTYTDKSLSDALIFIIILHQLTHNMATDCCWNYHENYNGRTWAEHFRGNSMNNLLSYCGLVDATATISASEKDLPVRIKIKFTVHSITFYGNSLNVFIQPFCSAIVQFWTFQ